MKRKALLTTRLLALVLVVLGSGRAAIAQEHDAPKVEVGVQFSSLTLFSPTDFGGDQTEPGFGGRITYNLNDHFALEAEGNFYPRKSFYSDVSGGRTVQGQFGVKAGKRFERFGVFGKVRPGFVSFSEATRYELEPRNGFTLIRFSNERRTHFSTDVGGVLEFYPSRRIVTRFDAGDTIIRYGEHEVIDFPAPTFAPALVKAPAQTKHNFQFTAGVGFRFGGADGDAGGTRQDARRSDDGSRDVSGFEFGVQFTSLSLNPPRQVSGSPVVTDDNFGPLTEPGFGGRVTYNLNDHFALEAEGNFYPRENFSTTNPPAGHMYQGQFGVKAGRRFGRFGLFGKARPGFVGFTRLMQLINTREEVILGRPVTTGEFRIKHKEYFSMDVGGVLEFYPSRRIVTRFDIGDTIIRYTERATPTIFLFQPIFRVPAETRHNFQFTAGIGFRF